MIEVSLLIEIHIVGNIQYADFVKWYNFETQS